MKEDFIVWLNTSTGWQLPDAVCKLSETVLASRVLINCSPQPGRESKR